MPTEFKVPELGENVSSGDVVRVLVKPGDAVTKDQPVLELETDKATIEVPSTVSGTVKDVAVKQGDKVKVGQVILRLDDAGAAAAKEGAPKPAAGGSSEGPKPQPAGAPEEGGMSQRATTQRAEGSSPKSSRGQEESSPSPAPAREEAFAAAAQPERSEAREMRKVVDISRGARPAAAEAVQAETAGAPVPASPSVRRMARELGVDIHRVHGSGQGGRISDEDVKAFVRTRSERGASAVAAEPLPDLQKWGEIERKPMSNVRRKTAEHLSYAWSSIPHVTQHDKADITALDALREKYSAKAEAAGGKLTVTAILVKVIAEAVKRFPQFNAAVDMDANEIVYRKYINVGVAVDTERGLLVPVVRDADRKTIIELSVEVATAAQKARDRKLGPDDMAGAGISITNLGGIGGTSFTPIVNAPEVAILGVSRASQEPVFVEGAFEPRLMLPLSLSYDHRVIDGADAARFLRWVCEALEQPLLLVL